MINNGDDRENRPVKYRISPDDMKLIHQRSIEAAELRQAESDLNLMKTVQLGQALRRLKAEGR